MKPLGKVLLIFSLLLLYAVYSGHIVHANEGIGGQVVTEGKISFYEESAESSNSKPTTPSTEKNLKPNRKKLPSTGEQVRMYSLIGFGIIFFSFLVFYFRKRRKENVE